MGTMAATLVAVIDLCRGGSCRGMLVGAPQGGAGGLHGLGTGAGGGDHSPAMAAGDRRGNAAHGCGTSSPRTDGGGSRAGEHQEGHSGAEPN